MGDSVRLRTARTLLERWEFKTTHLMIGQLIEDGHTSSQLDEIFSVKGIELTAKMRYYWRRKYNEPLTFHPGDHGGTRNVKFGPALRYFLRHVDFTVRRHFSIYNVILVRQLADLFFRLAVLLLIDSDPDLSFFDLVFQLNLVLRTVFGDHGPSISATTVSRLLRVLDYVWIVPIRFHAYKYRVENVMHYLHHVAAMQELDVARIKTLDECSFVSKGSRSVVSSHSQFFPHLFVVDIYRRRRVLARRGEKRVAVDHLNLDEQLHLTILTRLDRADDLSPLSFDYVHGSNTGVDFATFIQFLMREAHLVAGDYLVLDNARVHFTKALQRTLFTQLETRGVRHFTRLSHSSL